MIEFNKFGFVISRDGYILATNELYQNFFGSHSKYGIEGLTSPYRHYFPINQNVERIVYYDTIFAKIEMINSVINTTELIQAKIRKVKDKKKSVALLEKLKATRNGLVSDLNFGYKPNIVNEDGIKTIDPDRFIGIDDDGMIRIGRIEYRIEKDDTNKDVVTGCSRTIKFDRMIVGPGTDWVITYDSEDCRTLEAAMRSTETKEELLALLRKLGVIKVGEWITPKDYAQKHQLTQVIKDRNDECDKFILNCMEEKA